MTNPRQVTGEPCTKEFRPDTAAGGQEALTVIASGSGRNKYQEIDEK